VSIHSQIHHPIAYIKVKDLDTDQNANISLKLISDFADQKTINLVPVDEEKYELFVISMPTATEKECYQYTIVARDQGIPRQKSEKVYFYL